MIYMLLCISFFLAMSAFKSQCREWLSLALITALIWANSQIFDHNSDILYWNRAAITFAGAYYLCSIKSFLGYYQAFIYALTLLAYTALAYDVSQGRDILIYNNYEAVIYGLVICQIFGVFTTIRACHLDIYSIFNARVANLQRGYKR